MFLVLKLGSLSYIAYFLQAFFKFRILDARKSCSYQNNLFSDFEIDWNFKRESKQRDSQYTKVKFKNRKVLAINLTLLLFQEYDYEK